MPLGKTPAEIIINIDNKYYRIMPLLLNISPVSKLGVVEEIKDDVRQALKDLLDHAIAEMEVGKTMQTNVSMETASPSDSYLFYKELNRNATIDDCIAVLNKLKNTL